MYFWCMQMRSRYILLRVAWKLNIRSGLSAMFRLWKFACMPPLKRWKVCWPLLKGATIACNGHFCNCCISQKQNKTKQRMILYLERVKMWQLRKTDRKTWKVPAHTKIGPKVSLVTISNKVNTTTMSLSKNGTTPHKNPHSPSKNQNLGQVQGTMVKWDVLFFLLHWGRKSIWGPN